MPHTGKHDQHDGVRTVHSAYLPDHDHVHDEDAPGTLEDNPIWQQDNVTLHSVGMDIGSSGTQVVFSRLRLRRIGEDLTSRYLVVRRETLHLSPVELTPYASDEYIDAAGLGSIIDTAYRDAGVDPADVDTGVVILTGEALRRRNAEAIAGVLAERGGELVNASAGHHMEAMLAAYGSGAAQASYDTGRRILNVDIGGGTTKLAVLDRGRVTATAAVHIGGRLQVVDGAGRIVRLDPAGSAHAARAGFTWKTGDTVRPGELERVAESMADLLIEAVTADPPPRRVRELYLTDPLPDPGPIDGVMFSGGVAEYVYGREDADFGDLGRALGRALRRRVDAGALPYPLLPAGACIRATALGASEYSVQLSGNTGFVSDPDALLPRRNLQVLRPCYDLVETVDSKAVESAIRRHLVALDVDRTGTDIALALSWSGPPGHDRVLAFARGIRDAVADRTAQGRPLYVVLDGDIAMTLGRLLREELGLSGELLVIDGLSLRDFDYVDIGRVRFPSNTVPVTIKSLVFEQDPRQRRADTGTAG
ncbi:reactivating factor for ethanolamine ammonia lyase [Streptomyces spinoverrucosus]|uniref:Reactivating factor for ethanolamine ammonia lyase n=1 Tax=Streptomyces spinoverrucosus TaxID=284043 RepID=A0A4Y3VA22_9ACTN|nr:ethanolamine ammonia-lyase reactivating factor EutA [Streptomyces spinoverrucosus]GEC03223.1 reactivating factor for ethanolamine ammonia lyase [Streptomyces spinoverrucosus]GHB37302.1 reactivating factor for ethanolamine ammonia lyase [Streptomyces spinoverrucosus]